jgi:hypothetical protein
MMEAKVLKGEKKNYSSHIVMFFGRWQIFSRAKFEKRGRF